MMSTANKYYDFLQAGGPTVLGSNPKVVRDQVIELLNTCGPSTGLFHEFEYKLAKKVCDSVPNVEMFRMLNSGSEACMAAVRVARLATKNKNIIKMAAPITAGAISSPTASVFPAPSSHKRTGVPLYIFKHTQEFFPNDLNDLERKLRFNQMRGGTAAVFIEPVGPESGTRPLDKDFNKGVERLCRQIRRVARIRRGCHRLPYRHGRCAGLFRRFPPISRYSARSSRAVIRARADSAAKRNI